MGMPGRDTIFKTGYRYGFNGKEMDNETYGGQGNEYDYGFRIYNPRIGRFLSVDPLIKNYPELTPYQFASNSVISGIDLDGLEYYYTSSGALLGHYGKSTEVRIVNYEFVKNNYGKKILISDWNKNSRDVGITNEELNTRAFLSTIKQAENNGKGPLTYNSANGLKGGKVRTFTVNSYEDAPKDYANHPGDVNKTGSSAAGAYQILEGPYNGYKKLYPNEITDFSPLSQDKIALKMIEYRKATQDVENGNLENANKKLTKTAGGEQFASLPGGTQQGVDLNQEKELFKQNVSNELNQKSNIATPVGELLPPKKI